MPNPTPDSLSVKEAIEQKHLTRDEAEKFFAEFYFGSHHIPGMKVHEFGYGFMVKHDRGDLATYDFNHLTRLVLMAHRDCYRVSIENHGSRAMKIAICKRQREGGMCDRHPTIEQAIEQFHKTTHP
jgi:hypothetical protein